MKKFCRICKEEKQIDHFYKQKGMKDGYRNICKECSVGENLKRNLANVELYRQRAREYYQRRKNNPSFLLRMRIYNKQRRKIHPEIDHAQSLAQDHIKGKPCHCSICGQMKRLHKHHFDYSKPFDVVWCCAACHKQLHREIKRAA